VQLFGSRLRISLSQTNRRLSDGFPNAIAGKFPAIFPTKRATRPARREKKEAGSSKSDVVDAESIKSNGATTNRAPARFRQTETTIRSVPLFKVGLFKASRHARIARATMFAGS